MNTEAIKKLEKDIKQFSEKNLLIQRARNQAIMIARSYGMM